MNITQHADGRVTGVCTNAGGGNLTGYVVNTEPTPLLVLERRHFKGSYGKDHGVSAYFLGRGVAPDLFGMSFVNNNGQSCSTVTLTKSTPGEPQRSGCGPVLSMAAAPPPLPRPPPPPLPPLNCSWTTKWVNGSRAPIATLSLSQTATGPLRGSCTTTTPASVVRAEATKGSSTANGRSGCSVVRADQLPRLHAQPKRVVQVNVEVPAGMFVLGATLCPGGACGMVQWIGGDGSSGQLSLIASAGSACLA